MNEGAKIETYNDLVSGDTVAHIPQLRLGPGPNRGWRSEW